MALVLAIISMITRPGLRTLGRRSGELLGCIPYSSFLLNLRRNNTFLQLLSVCDFVQEA